jgi:putative ATPase
MINPNAAQPLADRLRPARLDEFIGQKHLVGEGKPLYQAIKNRRLHSMIFWGPPGVGKTTLAGIIADQIGMDFHALSAVSAGKNDIREVVETARGHSTPMDRLLDAEADPKRGAILFLDEIHRFNKAQQDYLLPFVEDGTLTLIGATTENPSFEVIPALLSRCRVYVLEALNEDDICQLVERGAQALNVTLEEEAADFLIRFANGDGRQTLNLLETAAELYTTDPDRALTLDHLREALQATYLRYDKASEEHYNTVSAYIKSMRAGDPDAALYYLARMVAAGEDPKFIARRMVIFASEDVGMAQPTALVVANEVFRAVETIGYPECQINLAHGTVYLATAAKDRSAYDAYFEALDDVKAHGNLSIPMQLRNAPTPLMKQLGYGKAEDEPTASLLPDKLKKRRYYKAKGSSG